MELELEKLIIYIFVIILTIIIPLIGSKYISKIEEDDTLKNKLILRKKDVLYMIGSGVIMVISVIYRDWNCELLSEMPDMYYISYTISSAILMGYLLFMSYTDQKTKLLYTLPSIIMLIIQVIIFAINWSTIKTYYINEYTWTIGILVLVLGIISLLGFLGLGDVIIYTVLGIYYTCFRNLPTMSLIYNIFLANLIFLVVTIILKVTKQDISKKQPLTIFIALSTLLCNTMFI